MKAGDDGHAGFDVAPWSRWTDTHGDKSGTGLNVANLSAWVGAMGEVWFLGRG